MQQLDELSTIKIIQWAAWKTGRRGQAAAAFLSKGKGQVIGKAGVFLMKARKKPISKMARREARNFYLYTAPWLIGFLVLTLYPMLYSLYLSFTNYK